MAVPSEVVTDNYSQDIHLSDELKFFVVNGQRAAMGFCLCALYPHFFTLIFIQCKPKIVGLIVDFIDDCLHVTYRSLSLFRYPIGKFERLKQVAQPWCGSIAMETCSRGTNTYER